LRNEQQVSAVDPTYVRTRELLEAELGDELVALDVTDGLCFGFNDVALSIWRRLAQPILLSALIAGLTEEYDVSRDEAGGWASSAVPPPERSPGSGIPIRQWRRSRCSSPRRPPSRSAA
jgi:hypothetical protein